MLYSPSANATGSRSGEGNHPYPSFTALQNVGVGAAVQHSLQMISQREPMYAPGPIWPQRPISPRPTRSLALWPAFRLQ